MKSKNFLLPMMAFICAIGMAFATINQSSDPELDYIVTESGVEIVEELNCEIGNTPCEARITPGGTPYPVYDDPALMTRKIGVGKVKNAF
ncbi:hypothetical protein DET49_10330 [Salegentibacter sp. 24]|uniref:DUF6520 family protein n=1 Tax=Salegentibacter sp. 24 TaxID=2183986 RepID=UPI00105FA04F|nr:DUF6520 family protein [Salegentibacter sp. 24]TDN94964.1 hypothetical protein DET49_10330 [Salegentibacter sp. 24]